MIKNPATRIIATVMLVAGLIATVPLDKSEPADSKATGPLAAQAPRFQILRRRDEITLSGHTSSRQHERDLLQAASSSYPEHRLVTAFQPLGIVPRHWEDTTIQVLYLLAETAAAQAEVSVDTITIRGVTVDEFGFQSRLNALKRALPDNVLVGVNTLAVDANINVHDLCERILAAFNAGAINFNESSADFRSSAYPRLDRVTAVANACAHSIVGISGHTDASGNEAWNQRLSLQRANAVADYIVEGGVDRARLQVAGVGSSVPVADDSTRYGRSINRRIEISLTSTDKAAERVGE